MNDFTQTLVDNQARIYEVYKKVRLGNSKILARYPDVLSGPVCFQLCQDLSIDMDIARASVYVIDELHLDKLSDCQCLQVSEVLCTIANIDVMDYLQLNSSLQRFQDHMIFIGSHNDSTMDPKPDCQGLVTLSVL